MRNGHNTNAFFLGLKTYAHIHTHTLRKNSSSLSPLSKKEKVNSPLSLPPPSLLNINPPHPLLTFSLHSTNAHLPRRNSHQRAPCPTMRFSHGVNPLLPATPVPCDPPWGDGKWMCERDVAERGEKERVDEIVVEEEEGKGEEDR